MSAARDDAALVAAMVRDCDFPRYASTLFAPIDKRPAMLVLAAFDLEIQRIPDQVSQPLPGEVRLQWWVDALEGTEHGGVAGHPVAAELLRAVEAYALPRAPLLALIEAHKFDLYDEAMPSLAALEVYCDDTVGALAHVNADLLSSGVALIEAFREAGRAFGIARMLSRMPHDAAHRRCFLPAEILARHGVTRHQILAGEDTPALRNARGEMIAAARRHFQKATLALKGSPARIRPAWLPFAKVDRTLDALEILPPFTLAPAPSRLRVLASQWWMMRG